MPDWYRQGLRPFLFKLEPELAHRVAAGALRALRYSPVCFNRVKKRNTVTDDRLRQTLFGREFANPVGLAAGFDKDATLVEALPALGFGFVEIGTVTPRPQPGNPKPRLFRFPEQESLRNAMGFNNDGMAAVRERLRGVYPAELPVGVNLGKNRTTPREQAMEDYTALIEGFGDLCDYLVVNVSSPNTPGLRDLQDAAFLAELFGAATRLTARPILLKLAPDMAPADAVRLAAAAVEHGATGIIATNTSLDDALLPYPRGPGGTGGISGKAIREQSFRVFEAIARELYGRTVLISAGGIDSGAEAYRRIKAGASLVQVYTALIFHGPSLVRRINEALLELLDKDGCRHIGEVAGADRRGS